MKLGKHQFGHQVSTLILALLLLVSTADEAYSFGKKPVPPPETPPPAPSLKVDNPQAGQIYPVGKAITVTGKSLNGITKTSLLMDGISLASSSSSNFSLSTVITSAQLGVRTLSVAAYDKAGKALARIDYKVEVKAAAVVPAITVENLKDNQNFNEDDNALFYIVGAGGVDGVEISKNGKLLGQAEYVPAQNKFKFGYIFSDVGAYDLKFAGKIAGQEVATKTFRVNVLVKANPPPVAKNFNAYILKAVDKIRAEHALRGYNIKAQLTHDLSYGSKGTLKSTYGELTMCVSAALEMIITAYDIYARETGDRTVYDYLPFSSWNSLASTSIKAHIWVDSKLDSYGTADALAHFGMGENVPFSELQPGSFINLNRDNKTGHAVVFIAFIDIKANELARYDAAKVAGFKYFSAQGKEAVGQGGFDYRYAFFSKNGCPTISYRRDCGLMYSTNRKYLNTGVMWHPRDWRKPASVNASGVRTMALPAEVSAEDAELSGRAAGFNGLTTDD